MPRKPLLISNSLRIDKDLAFNEFHVSGNSNACVRLVESQKLGTRSLMSVERPETVPSGLSRFERIFGTAMLITEFRTQEQRADFELELKTRPRDTLNTFYSLLLAPENLGTFLHYSGDQDKKITDIKRGIFPDRKYYQAHIGGIMGARKPGISVYNINPR